MALDQEALEAVRRIAADPVCRQWLNTRTLPNSKQNLRNYIYNFDDLDVAHLLDEIVEEAWRLVFQPGAIGGDTSKPNKPERGSATKRQRFDESMVTAPFRFIELSDTVVPPESEDPVPLDWPKPGHYSGRIVFELVAETPLLIGAPSGAPVEGREESRPVEPLQLGANGPWVIPGATVRGLLRRACEIVGYGKLQRGNWHHQYGMRDFTHRVYQESSVSRVDEVHAGFLHVRHARPDDDAAVVTEAGEVFELTPAKRWAHVPIAALNDVGIDARTEKKDPDDRREKLWINLTLEEKYRAAGMLHASGRLDFTKTRGFSDLRKRQSGGLEAKPVSTGGVAGLLVFAGPFPGNGNKKVEYAFFEDPAALPIALPRDRAQLFVAINSKPSKNKAEPDGSWKALRPFALDSRIPVFYVGDPVRGGRDFFFGLTRLFKVPHNLTVGGVLAESQPVHVGGPVIERRASDGKQVLTGYCDDLVEHLFGYVNEPKDLVQNYERESFDPAGIARKGRVACGFMTIAEDTPARAVDEPAVVVQMAPRGSFAPFYLRSGDKARFEKDYSISDVRLAGRKSYFPRYTNADPKAAAEAIRAQGRRQIDMIRESSRGRSDGRDTWSHLKFLMPACDRPPVFSGEMRLHNVSAVEVGLLLFALTHGGDAARQYRHMVGRARAFGAGQMRVGRVRLMLEPNGAGDARLKAPAADEIHDPATGRGFAPAGGGALSLEPFLAAFIDYMRSKIPGYPNVAPVEEWLGMSDPAEGEKASQTLAYQPLKSFSKVRDMFKPLPAGSEAPQRLERLLPAPRVRRGS